MTNFVIVIVSLILVAIHNNNYCLAENNTSSVCPGKFGETHYDATLDTLSGDPNVIVQILDIIPLQTNDTEAAFENCKALCCKSEFCEALVLAPGVDDSARNFCNLFTCTPISRCHLTSGNGLLTVLLDRSANNTELDVQKRVEQNVTMLTTQSQTNTSSNSTAGSSNSTAGSSNSTAGSSNSTAGSTETWPPYTGSTENHGKNETSAPLSTNTWPINPSPENTNSTTTGSTAAQNNETSSTSATQNTTLESTSTAGMSSASQSSHKVLKTSAVTSKSTIVVPISVEINNSSTPETNNNIKKDNIKDDSPKGLHTSFLVTSLIIGVIFLVVICLVGGKQMYDRYQRRHYRAIDPLLNGSEPLTGQDKLTHDY